MVHWSRECPKDELAIQIESVYVSRHPRVLKICYDYEKDGNFIRDYPQCRFVSQLRSSHISCQVRAQGFVMTKERLVNGLESVPYMGYSSLRLVS